MGKQLTKHMTTKIVNFNFPIVGLDDKPILLGENGSTELANAGKILATRLSSMNEGDTFKLMEWARKCYKGEDIELNPAEEKIFYDFIDKSRDLTVLAKEQMLIKFSK